MPAILARQTDSRIELDAPFLKLLVGLGWAAAAASVAMLVLAGWCALRVCRTHSDRQRCRAVGFLSASYLLHAVCQLVLARQPAATHNEGIVQACLVGATASTVFNAFLVAGAIGIDAAVRYGLRSFVLARRLARYWEIGSLGCAVVVCQPLLYVFGDLRWTGSAIVVAEDRASFDAAVWMVESAWTALALAAAAAAAAYAVAKAHKMKRYAAAAAAHESPLSALGTVAGVQTRAVVALCYVLVLATTGAWRLAFRVGGSASLRLLSAASIGEALQPVLLLTVFCADAALGARCPVWLGPAPGLAGAAAAEDAIGAPTQARSGRRRSTIRSFTGWRKTSFLEWQRACADQPQAKDKLAGGLGLWASEVQPCYIRPDAGWPGRGSRSVSEASCCSDSHIMRL
ncbi:hypothetical protein H4R18_000069 [Coemansia javaensis]|uniref:Uncharacterized protein n=1 Tax=Coemansia javaensis TaxID=2761396 RepID=A0A9W8LMP8_9FUNG|nr:hypothetical protein H4R18_000069 [Coemansia javaensis]